MSVFGKGFNQRIYTYDIQEDTTVKIPVYDLDTSVFNGSFLNKVANSFAENDVFSEHIIFTNPLRSATIYDSATLYSFKSFYPQPDIKSYVGVITETKHHGIVYLYNIPLKTLNELGIRQTGNYTEIQFIKTNLIGGPYPDANGYDLLFAIGPKKEIMLVDLFYEKLAVFSFDLYKKYESLEPLYKKQQELFYWINDFLPVYGTVSK